MKAKPVVLSVTYMLIFSVVAGAEELPVFSDARQVLAQFAESRKNLESYIVKSDEKCTFTYPGFSGTGISYSKVEQRFDGNRYKSIWYLWGDINIKVRGVKEENADYQSNLWDGQTAYIYSRGKNPHVGKYVSGVTVDRGDKKGMCSEAFKRTHFGEIMGYHWGDDVQIDKLFLQPSVKLRLRNERSNVNGVDCYVIDADVPGKGKYTVWIDPVHAFHIARIQVQRKTGDRIMNQAIGKNATHRELFEVLDFEKVQDAWFPKTCKEKRTNHSDGYHAVTERETTFSTITLNPDHKALGSFLPDDIPDGTPAKLLYRPPSEEYVWRDGKVVSAPEKEAAQDRTNKK